MPISGLVAEEGGFKGLTLTDIITALLVYSVIAHNLIGRQEIVRMDPRSVCKEHLCITIR